MSPGNTKSLGKKAEDMAARYLKEQGYRILERNLQLKQGEIDILARQGSTLVIVEVKSAGEGSEFGHPVFHVDAKKQRKLRSLGNELILKNQFHKTDIRFDVVSVDYRTGEPIIELIENAF